MSRIGKCVIISAVLALATLSNAAWAGRGNGNGGNDEDRVSDELGVEEIAGLQFMREEEKLARDTYLVLYEEWGLTVFENIAASEQQHTDTIESLLEKYDLEDPVASEDEIGGFVDEHLVELFDGLIAKGLLSATDGLVVGAMIEETDIVDIQEQIEAAHHEDIITAYENLMCGSRNHLRAFARNLESVGYVYEPIILGDGFWEIADSPLEQCGGH
ncbi:MAG: DUF2202 domain-containing protein [Xanthomonadales bacterium]